MTLKNYLFLMSMSTAICWLVFCFVLFIIDPYATNGVGFILFYSSAFLALMGTSAIFGFLIRFKIFKKPLAFRQVAEAFRQSFLFALLIVIVLFLLSNNLFTWINLILLVFGISLLEYVLVERLRSKILKKNN